VHIAIDYTPAVFQGAGIGRHTRGLVKALASLASGHDVTLVVYGRPRDAPVVFPAGCQGRIIPVANRWLTVAWYRLNLPLPADWLTGEVDLYHASDFVLPPVSRAKTVLTVHDLSFLTVPQCADPSLQGFLSRVVPRSVAQADHILADSQNTRQDLMRLLRVPGDRITVVYPGVEGRFSPQQDKATLQQVRTKYGIGDAPFVLGLGTLEPRKNWPALIRAWTLLKERTSLPHRLVIAGGKGWLFQGIFEAAEASGLVHDIVFPGFVEDADLPALYAAADVFAFPSLYEGFGIPVLEAMACGTPVVCASNSSLPEAAGDAALLVPTADDEQLASALQRLVQDDDLRYQLSRRGPHHASRFTWQNAAHVLVKTYGQVHHG
jgi:glycosyltransferase involved in cell wall biosynthesis